MALYRIGNFVYTPIYPEKGKGVMTHVYDLNSKKLIYSTQAYNNIKDAKNASVMLVDALEKRTLANPQRT